MSNTFRGKRGSFLVYHNNLASNNYKFQMKQKVVNKANKIVGFLKRNFGPGNKEIFSRLYKALVIPILEYTVPIWSPYLQKNIDAFERVQRRASKYTLPISYTGTLRMKEDWQCLGGPVSNQGGLIYLC